LHGIVGQESQASNKDRIVVAIVKGSARNVLLGERTALNMLARCSGIATRCRKLAQLKQKYQWKGCIAGTRKTTPGFRLVEKYGMLVGGCDSHRMNLSSMVMLKDNHIYATGSITNAIAKAKSAAGFSVKIEVETSNFQEAREAADGGADIVMLDNCDPATLHQTAEKLRVTSRRADFLIEASGGITMDTIDRYFGPNINVISMGSITQGVGFVDFSLKINRDQ